MIGTLHRRLDSKDCLLSGDPRNRLVVCFVKKSIARAPDAQEPVMSLFTTRSRATTDRRQP